MTRTDGLRERIIHVMTASETVPEGSIWLSQGAKDYTIIKRHSDTHVFFQHENATEMKQMLITAFLKKYSRKFPKSMVS